MSIAALIISCAAIAVTGYQLYWLRRLRAAVRKIEQTQAVRRGILTRSGDL